MIITASKKKLHELTDSNDPTSPFYNTFAHLPLDVFTNEGAEDFVNIYRKGVPPFTEDEKKKILNFAKRHPLALQVASYYVLEAKTREPASAILPKAVSVALNKAADEMRGILPQGW